MEYKVELADGAENDLFEIYYYIAVHDSFDAAEKVTARIRDACNKLATFPFRGHKPHESKDADPQLLEIIHDVYRIIYEVVEKNVNILFIIDGRRNVQEVLGNLLSD